MRNNFKNIELLNPKRIAEDSNDRTTWYEYYAGYSPKFAYNLLKSIKLKPGSKILDPWNGIGTTTIAASALGINSIGYDLNPAPVIISKALRLGFGEKPSIKPLLKEIIAKSTKFVSEDNDPFVTWFDSSTSDHLRGIEKAIQQLLVSRSGKYNFILNEVDRVSDIASFFYVALFRVLRILVDDFIGSNPTWVKRAKENHVSYNRKIIISLFEGEIEKMLFNFSPIFNNSKENKSVLSIGDSMHMIAEKEEIDFLLSSPPYCTRIDYAVYTMPELSVLGYNSKSNWTDLRIKLIGSTTVPEIMPKIDLKWGNTCCVFIQELTSHYSKASHSYYLKNHLQYFDTMFKSINEASRVLKKGGGCALVVQDSYYKEIHNDLPSIISEMAENTGLELVSKREFKAASNMAGVNPGTKKYRNHTDATESVLVFAK